METAPALKRKPTHARDVAAPLRDCQLLARQTKHLALKRRDWYRAFSPDTTHRCPHAELEPERHRSASSSSSPASIYLLFTLSIYISIFFVTLHIYRHVTSPKYNICYVHIACVRLSIYIWHAIYRVRLMTTIRRPFWFGTQQQICWKLVHAVWRA